MANNPTAPYRTLQEEQQATFQELNAVKVELRVKEAASSQRMAQPQVITQQPTSFSAMCLDPASQGVYNTLTTKHMSGHDIVGQVNDMGSNLLQNVQGKFVSIKGNMSYGDLITGLIRSGENIVSQSPHLQYNSLVITDENGVITESKFGGIAMLTDKRLLFLSSQCFHKFSLTPFGDPKKLPGGYNMEMSCQDTTYYAPIALHAFRSIEMEGRTGVSGNIPLHASQPPCGGCCGLCGCLKKWIQFPMAYSEFNEMILRLGVLRPPWDKRAFMKIYIKPEVPTAYVRDFTSMLQTYAKNLS